MAILLSDRAAEEIKGIIKQQNLPADATRLRVGVKGGGCSGFTYVLDLTEEVAGEADDEIESHGIQILIDNKSHMYLEGTEIDYKTNGMLGGGFVFKNPNASSTCGCGSSFSA
jgi:iron-sulfur cluster assembly protein